MTLRRRCDLRVAGVGPPLRCGGPARPIKRIRRAEAVSYSVAASPVVSGPVVSGPVVSDSAVSGPVVS